jgi:hypothetical protein
MSSSSENAKTWTIQYFYISEEDRYLEAKLEAHSKNDSDTIHINHSGFKEFAKNLGINLEEFRFKYSPVSEVCEHLDSDSERCYNLFEITCIFTQLKPGSVRTKDYLCCSSKISLCSTEMRDMVCRNLLNNDPSGFGISDGECVLNEDVHWLLSKQRLRSLGVLFEVEGKECTFGQYPSNYFAWSRYFKKRKQNIRKAVRLGSQKSLIYRDKDNLSEYY